MLRCIPAQAIRRRSRFNPAATLLSQVSTVVSERHGMALLKPAVLSREPALLQHVVGILGDEVNTWRVSSPEWIFRYKCLIGAEGREYHDSVRLMCGSSLVLYRSLSICLGLMVIGVGCEITEMRRGVGCGYFLAWGVIVHACSPRPHGIHFRWWEQQWPSMVWSSSRLRYLPPIRRW